MALVRETVSIAAPADRVWHVVHEDVRNFTKWTTNVKRVQKVSPGPPGEGAIYRYVLDTPAGEHVLEIEHLEWRRPRRCAGEYIRGPVTGTWSYSYSERDGQTRLTYVSDFRLTGVLRLMTAAFLPHYRNGVRDNLRNLKRYVEEGG
jgi:uncharacterized membrane protein